MSPLSCERPFKFAQYFDCKSLLTVVATSAPGRRRAFSKRIQTAHRWGAMAADCPQIAGTIIDDFVGTYYANDSFSKLSLSDVRT
jgi:hypothetical protein